MNTELESIGKSQQLVVFKLDKEEYGSDIDHIKEIVNIPQITRIPKTPDFIKGIMSLRGQVLAVIDLRRRFGFSENPEIQSQHVVIVEGEDFSVGMIVDEVTDVLRVSEENFEPVPQLFETAVDDKHVDGVALIGDRLIIRLNPLKVLTADETAQIGELTADQEPQEEKTKPKTKASDTKQEKSD